MATHDSLPASGANFRMIDVGDKADTKRCALASGLFSAAPDTMRRIQERSLPKGDVLLLAESAGLQGAKSTSQLLPLCHPLSLTAVKVWHAFEEGGVRFFCETQCVGKTGVEMEALAGVQTALLCVYDLTKAIDPVLLISDVGLEYKLGGKSGVWTNPQRPHSRNHLAHAMQQKPSSGASLPLQGIPSHVIVLSDSASAGESRDASGPLALDLLRAAGAMPHKTHLIPDSPSALHEILSTLIPHEGPQLVLTSGGTGLSPRDITPETLEAFACDHGGRAIPGFGELLRQGGARFTAAAWLSRQSAWIFGQTLIIALPGSPKAVQEGFGLLLPLLPHAFSMAQGRKHP